MNVRLLGSLSLVAVAGLAAAYALGLFEPAGARPAAPAHAVAAQPPEAARPSEPAERVEPAERAERAEPLAPRVPRVPSVPSVPTTGSLRIDSDVRGADVFIDNAFVGQTPVVVDGVAPGRRKINVSADGYETAGGFHDIAPGPSELTIPVRIIRLDRRVAVRHKHGVGSCEGILAASPDGIRYETANRDHAFRAALTTLQTFEADYLAKNLRVVTGGRTYNFTMGGTASVDDLYGFQQEVDKVRRRLMDGND